MNSPKESPAFKLADLGYDVWLGNTRGNKYSRDHQSLDPDAPNDEDQFWNIGFEDMGYYDIPAQINHALSVTGQSKLAMVAHSQGSTAVLYAMTTDRLAFLKQKVSVFVALGPVAKLTHCTSELVRTMSNQEWIIKILKRLDVHELFPENYVQNQAFGAVCNVLPKICDLGISLIADSNTSVLNQDRLGVFMAHYPSGSSFKGFDHFGQIYRANKFQRYDYGQEANMNIYGQITPPEIDLSLIKGMKIAQFVGKYDQLSDPTDNAWLTQQLAPNLIFNGTYELGHMGFLMAKDMSYFDKVIEIIGANQ